MISFNIAGPTPSWGIKHAKSMPALLCHLYAGFYHDFNQALYAQLETWRLAAGMTSPVFEHFPAVQCSDGAFDISKIRNIRDADKLTYLKQYINIELEGRGLPATYWTDYVYPYMGALNGNGSEVQLHAGMATDTSTKLQTNGLRGLKDH